MQAIVKWAVALLCAYDWPGNVRQLENAVFRAIVLCEGDELTIAEFPQIALRSDRRSVYEQEDYGFADAIAREAELASEARRKEAMPGAQRFAQGKGRHGSFHDI